MFYLFLTLLMSPISAFCELNWLSNSTTVYYTPEIGNSISSLAYSVFGISGLVLQNYPTFYYFIMNLFILTGIASFLHHYYLYNSPWTHAVDVICMELLTVFSLFYIVCDNEYTHIKLCKKFFSFIILLKCVSMLTLFKINFGERTLVLQITMGCIVLTQIVLFIIYLVNDLSYKSQILKTCIWNAILFATGVSMWYIDTNCPLWMSKIHFNGHAIWHVSLAWALFNVLNITNLARFRYNKIKFIWKPLIKCTPWFLFVILVAPAKPQIRLITVEQTTEMSRLLAKKHRRNNTIG
jgi:hypothetical protein